MNMLSVVAAFLFLVWSLASTAETPSQTWVWTCSATRGSATVIGQTTIYPTCSAGGGAWVQLASVSDPAGMVDITPLQNQINTIAANGQWWGYQVAGDQVAQLLSTLALFGAVVFVVKHARKMMNTRS